MTLTSDTRLSTLVTTHAGASRVLHRHRLDFCCGGQRTLAEACETAGEDVAALLSELEEALDPAAQPAMTWDDAPLAALIEHILERYHARHREDLPRLVEMARKVEDVHADREDVPHGLADHLEAMTASMEEHMQKEEQVLFPLLVAGRGPLAGAPIHCMEAEHRDHAVNLQRLRVLASSYVPPAGACNTWRALYLGLEALDRELMEHMHLENNVLFPRALRG